MIKKINNKYYKILMIVYKKIKLNKFKHNKILQININYNQIINKNN